MTDPGRKFFTELLDLHKFQGVRPDEIAGRYCQSCIDRMLQECADFDQTYGLGVLEYSSGEIRLLQKRVTGFTLGNYYVSVLSYQEEEQLHLLIFYCPPE